MRAASEDTHRQSKINLFVAGFYLGAAQTPSAMSTLSSLTHSCCSEAETFATKTSLN